MVKSSSRLILLLFLFTCNSFSSELENLARKGFAVAFITRAEGTFNGCNFDERIDFWDGSSFVCKISQYQKGINNPEVLILKNIRSSEIRVLIDNKEYHGVYNLLGR